MAQATTLTINDGQATPVAVAFTPEAVSPALSTFTDRSSGTAVGFRRITVSSKFASGKSVVNRSRLAIEYPIVTTINGVSTLAYTLRASVDIVIPDASTVAERNNLYAFVANSLANTALIRPAMRDLDPIY